jgi:hypothetical protein
MDMKKQINMCLFMSIIILLNQIKLNLKMT